MLEYFDWDDANIAHIAEHSILPEETEEVIANQPLDLDYEKRDGEGRFRQVGETSLGRVLVVVTTDRGVRTRVVTAYSASRSLRIIYLRYKEREHYGKANPS